MRNYVLIELDRTPPQINIYAPRYTTKEIVNTIIIESNEPLSNYQEIYVIDYDGVRHDYTFSKDGENRYIGNIRFANFNYGIVTLYARLQDNVGNISSVTSFPIEIKDSISSLKLDIRDKIMKIETSIKGTDTRVSDKSFNIYTKDDSLS